MVSFVKSNIFLHSLVLRRDVMLLDVDVVLRLFIELKIY